MKLIDLTRINQLIDGLLDKINDKYTTKAELDSRLKGKADANHGTHLTLGTTSSTAFRGDYGNTAYKHSQAAHAPSNAQKNSDITKAEIEAKLTGGITTHTHSVLTMKNDNFKDNSALPSSYERGETLFFSNSPSSNKFNDLQYTMIQTLKEYGSGSAAWQFAYPYNSNNDTFFVRNAQYGTDSWREWAEVYTSLNKPTPEDIGAAKASHGTHVTYASAAPKANGTAAVGTSAKVAREDHVHPLQTTVSGNAGSANKVNNSIKIQLNGGTTEGTNQFTFNGSTAKNINITPSSIGAAASSHTHSSYVNQNAFSNVKVGDTTVAADTTTDTLTLVAGSNVTITPDATNDKITIAAKDTVYTHPSSHAATMITQDSTHRFVTDTEKSTWNAKASTAVATTSANGLMSSTDKSKLDGIAKGAQKNSDITKAEIEAKLTGDITTHKHTLLESNDTRSKNELPSTYTNRGIVPEFKSSATIGLPEVGKGFTGLITYQQWSDTSAWSGGKATQFGTIDDGRMYYRKGDGSGWGTWYQFYTTQNKPTPADIGAAKANHGTHVSYGGNGSATTVSRSDHTHSYLPLSGGTMTGNVSYQFTGTGGHAIGLAWKNNDTNKTTFGGIGALANAGTGSSLYIGWGSEPWVASNNLQVSSSGIKYKNNKIYHAGDKPTPADIGAAKASHGNHVPTTQAAQNNVFLRNDNTWQKITPENIGAAAASHGTHVSYGGNGSAATVSRSDHTHSSYVNQNAFSNVKVGDTTVAADTTTDTLTLVAGSNVTITPDATNDKITIAATDTTYSAATSSAAGLMSANDKSKLDGIATGANKYTHPTYTSKTSGLYKVTVDGTGHVSATAAVTSSDIANLGVKITDTTYSTGTASALGLTKLYTGTGTATDGTMTQKAIKSALDGKANSSHGTHVTYSTTTPKVAGTGAVGSASEVARADHVHPVQTTVSGNAGSATKLATARNIVIGNKTNNFNGSANITYTLNEIGATETVAWNTSIKCATWSRLFQFASSDATTGGTFLVNIRATRSSVVYNPTLLVNFSHASVCNIVQINNTSYSNIKVRGVVDNNGAGYFEIYDNVNSTTNSTTQSVSVTVTKISSGLTITKYTAFTNGTTIPTNYASKGEITTVSGAYYSGTAAKAGTATSASSATKATQDSAGQQINTTYIKGLSVSGRTITYTKGDGTTGTITTQDNNTTYTADTGIKLNGTKFQHTNAVTAGTAQGDANKTLSWGGTFTIPTVTYDAQGHITGKGTTTMTMPGNPNTDTHHQAKNIVGASATATANATATNGNVYLNLIENGAVRSKHKIAGTGATTVTSDSSGNITINSTNTTYGVATTSANGLMSSSDKSKLDGIAAGANKYTHPSYTAKSSGLYKITVDATGHVSATTAVAKSDITALGIPGSDTNTWRGVQDNLTSTATDQSLSANQGKVLKGLIDGKLDASHANTTHLTIGTGAGNAAAGNHTHNYAGSSSAGGAATSANKVNASMKIQLNSGTTEGTNQFTFNGSTAKNINITPSAIGLSGLSSSSNELKYSGSNYNSGGSRVSLGYSNTVTGPIAIGLGQENQVTGKNSLGLGKKNSCTTHNTFMIGIGNEVVYSTNYEWANSFVFGENNKLGFKEGESAGVLPTNAEAAYGAIALGQYNYVGNKCAVIGDSNRAKNYSYAIGANCSACDRSAAIGLECNALSNSSTAVGNGATATGGSYASAFGYYSRAEASYALAMGNSAYAKATRAVAVGGKAEEEESLAVGTYSNALGKCSAALTPHTYAIGENSVCVGYAAETNAKNAMAIGYQTKVGDTGEGVTAMGHFNETAVTGCSAGTTGTALVIGNGASDNARSNACRITFAGAVIGKAAYQSSGADYAEYFEWLDGNTDNEDRRGYFVTMDGNKIKKAKEGDYILGVVSAYPAVIGNNDMEWSGKFLLDEFGDPIKKVQKTIIKEHELIKDVHFTDEEMQTLTYEERKQREMKEVEKEVECEYFVLNPDFDPDREYVHRADRPEWDTIGMLGVLTVYDDGTCQVNGFCKCNNDGIATACERGFDTYRVIGRVNENLIKIVFK